MKPLITASSINGQTMQGAITIAFALPGENEILVPLAPLYACLAFLNEPCVWLSKEEAQKRGQYYGKTLDRYDSLLSVGQLANVLEHKNVVTLVKDPGVTQKHQVLQKLRLQVVRYHHEDCFTSVEEDWRAMAFEDTLQLTLWDIPCGTLANRPIPCGFAIKLTLVGFETGIQPEDVTTVRDLLASDLRQAYSS